MLRALIFDFDGLILDTETPEMEAWRATYREHGHELPLDLWLRNVGTHGAFDPSGHLESLVGRPLDRADLDARRRADHEKRCWSLAVLPGVREVMAGARERGLRLGLASSSSKGWVQGLLDTHRLGFDCVRTRDDVEQVKPAPDLYLAAARALDVAPGECLALEDSPNGMRAALAAGMRCVVVPCALTAGCEFPGAHARLTSLTDLHLADFE